MGEALPVNTQPTALRAGLTPWTPPARSRYSRSVVGVAMGSLGRKPSELSGAST